MKAILVYFDTLVNFGMLVLNVIRYKLHVTQTPMKAIILAAGEGKRMRPLTLETPKPMIQVLGKPLLHWIVESLPSEITELVIVVGYKGEQIQKYFGNKFEGRSVTYVVQEKAMGTGHALHLCKHLIKAGEKFLFMFADDLHSPEALKRLVQGGVGVLAHPHSDPARFGVLEIDENNRIVGIEEKPKQPKTNLVAVGVYVFDSSFFTYPMPVSARGEYEYIEPLLGMIRDFNVTIEKTDFWHPIGYPHDIDAAEELLLKKYPIRPAQKYFTPVLILAGGKGTRMPDNEKDKPKCLVDVAGRPMLAWQIEELHKQGFFNITLALGYKADMVVDWLTKNNHGDIAYVIEKEPLGTGGALKLALGGRKESFIGINCDDFADINFTSLMRHSCDGKYNVLSAADIADARTFGLIECDEFRKVCKFKEKDPNSTQGLVSIGHYYLQPNIFDGREGKFMIEHDVFPDLAADGNLVLHRHAGYWVTANDAEQLKGAREHFAKKTK